MKFAKQIIAGLVCVILLLSNTMIFSLINVNSEDSLKISTENLYKKEEIASTTSRGSKSRSTEYDIYEFLVNGHIVLYFDNIEEANKQKDYLLKNTKGLDILINETIKSSNECVTSELTIKNTIEKYIYEYQEKIRIQEENRTCFPTVSRKVSSVYGKRPTRGDFHSGIDMCGQYGDNIYAYKIGTVVKVQHSNVSYGNMVLIKHKDGTQSRYAHMSTISVANGQNVSCGQIIGHMGSTGNSTGNHLHFEIIINGKTVNPYNYIF